LSGKTIFVVMPFSPTASCKNWDIVFKHVFHPAIKACGYTCERAKPSTGNLTESIIGNLRNARIVLADITDQNPNVFYELGIRHSLSKRTIIIAQKSSMIPSDIRGYWFLNYGLGPDEVTQFREELKRIVKEIEKCPDKTDSPVIDYLEKEQIGISNYLEKENAKKLGALYTELSAIINTLNMMKIDPLYKDYLDFGCLNLLLDTLYIDVGDELLTEFLKFKQNLIGFKNGHVSHSDLALNVEIASRLKQTILEIRNKIQLGQFSEPNTITTIEWKTATCLPKEAKKTQTPSGYSTPIPIGKKQIKQLKEALDKRNADKSN
jgi:hypothetical protein